MIQEVPVDVASSINSDAVKAILVHVVTHPLHETLPHSGVLVVEVGQAVQLAMFEEIGSTIVVRIMDETAVVRVVVLRLVERFQDGHVTSVAGINLWTSSMIHVHVHDDFHLTLMQKHHHVLDFILCSVGWIYLRQILCPIAVVAMRHLIHNGGKHNAIHSKLLKVSYFVHDAGDSAAAVVVQLVTMSRIWAGKAVNQNLIHGNLRPCPRTHRQVVPLLLACVLRTIPHASCQCTKPGSLLNIRLVLVLDEGLIEELLVAFDLGIRTVLSTPMALVAGMC
mmetsp:Transcript_62982/g.111867  ORF Transcript_62982/g.111867 Transcript_62982/m.111867 type:complete len:280 (-) Transcript_62982:1511-2350(-)